MKVSFARKFQDGGSAGGTGTSTVDVAAGGSSKGDFWKRLANAEGKSLGSKYDVATNLIDAGTDIWANKVWEKYAKERVRDERDVSREVAKSKDLRTRAFAAANQFDKSGIGTVALAGAAGLTGVGMYHLMDDDYSAMARKLGESFGTMFANSSATGKASNLVTGGSEVPVDAGVKNTTATNAGSIATGETGGAVNTNLATGEIGSGIPANGVQRVISNRTFGSTQAYSANQASANYAGTVYTGKLGRKLIARH